MKSRINDDFLKVYRKLPQDVREQARKVYIRYFRSKKANHDPTRT